MRDGQTSRTECVCERVRETAERQRESDTKTGDRREKKEKDRDENTRRSKEGYRQTRVKQLGI